MATISWISLNGGDWADGLNWQGNVVPGPLDDAVLNLSVAETITVSDFQRVHSVSFHDPAATYVVTASGTLSASADVVMEGATFTAEGTLIASDITFITTQGVTGPVTNGGTMAGGGIFGVTSGILTLGTVVSVPPVPVALAAGATYDAILPRQTIYSGGFGSHVRLSSALDVFFGHPFSGDFITDSGTGSTIMGGGGLTRVDVTSGAPLVFGGTGSLFFSGTNLLANTITAPTVVGGGGAASVFANAGGGQFWGGLGDMLFVGGSGNSTVTAGFGHSTLFGGTGHDLLVSGTGFCTMTGGGDGAVLVAGSASFSNVLIAGGGNETLVGTANPFGSLMFAGSGSDAMFGGAGRDTFVAASGDAQMIASSGVDEFIFSNGASGGRTVIWNFTQGLDHAALFGYGVNAARDAVANATVAFGSTTVTLADNTRITFANVSNLTARDFL